MPQHIQVGSSKKNKGGKPLSMDGHGKTRGGKTIDCGWPWNIFGEMELHEFAIGQGKTLSVLDSDKEINRSPSDHAWAATVVCGMLI